MTPTIGLFKTRAGWMAKFSDPAIAELFGSDTLPTAFTCRCSEQDVLKEVSRLNPNTRVEFLPFLSTI